MKKSQKRRLQTTNLAVDLLEWTRLKQAEGCQIEDILTAMLTAARTLADAHDEKKAAEEKAAAQHLQ